MTDGRRTVEQVRSAQPDGALLERYSKQAAQHQLRALTELARMEDLAAGSPLGGQQREVLLYALSEALMAWRLLHYAQQEAASREAARRLQSRLGRVCTLVESIERGLYAPEAGSLVHEGARP